jgi:glycosyltransferase involved in cell wall biosynthesis
MKSVLMLTPFFSPNVGGVETHLDDLTVFLQKKNFRQVVVAYQPLTTPRAGAPWREKRKNLVIYRLPWLKFNLFYRLESKPYFQFPYLFLGIFSFALFYLFFERKKIGIIHTHGLAATVAGLILTKIFRKKLIVSIHTIYKFAQRPILAMVVRKLFASVKAILVLSQGAKEDIVAIGISPKKIYVYTNWLDLKRKFYCRDKKECRQKLGWPESDFVILFVGRLSPEKGVKLLLETISRISTKVSFVIVGSGPMQSAVETVAKKNPKVKYVGSVASDFLPFYYGAADILFWGSVDRDYFGRVTMGALASGLPVIIPSKTEYFGLEQPVEIKFPQNKIGYMLDPDPSLVARKIEELERARVSEKMRKACRQYALTHFSERNARVFLGVYRN